METTTANLNNGSSANGASSQPNFVAAALNAFNSSFNHNNAAAAAGLLARLSANRHLNNLNSINNNSASAANLTNGNALNNPLNPFSSGHFANLAAAAAISPYSLPSSYADFYHNFNLLNQQQPLAADTNTPTNSNSSVNGAHTTNQTAASLISSQSANGLYSIDNLLSPSMLSSANLIAHLNSVNNGTIPTQFAKNSSLESVLREAAENGLKKKGLFCSVQILGSLISSFWFYKIFISLV